MKQKKLIVLLMITAFTLGAAGMSFSEQEVSGTVYQIDGNTLTIMDDSGKQVTIQVEDEESLQEVKVGDRVLVKEGKVSVKRT